MDNIIKQINSCSELDLTSNSIGTKGAVGIYKPLLTNNCLHTLDLSYNNIGAEYVVEIINILEENYTLTEICLGPWIDSTRITNRNKDLLKNRRFTNTKLAAI